MACCWGLLAGGGALFDEEGPAGFGAQSTEGVRVWVSTESMRLPIGARVSRMHGRLETAETELSESTGSSALQSYVKN